MRGAFSISIVLRFNTKRKKNVVRAPAFGGPLGFSLVSLMDNMALPASRSIRTWYQLPNNECAPLSYARCSVTTSGVILTSNNE